MKCDCGEYFNMRDLQQVFDHLHPLKMPRAECGYSCKVETYSRKNPSDGYE